MKLTIAVCTFNERLLGALNLVQKIPNYIEVVLSHQCDNYSLSKEEKLTIQLINGVRPFTYSRIEGRGLSKNRNNALKVAKGNYVWLQDDDVEILSEAYDEILKELSSLDYPDILTFSFLNSEGEFYKNYSDFNYRHSYKSILRVSSIETVVKKDFIQNNNLFFDDRFGVGAEFPTGEENIFLTDCLKKGAIAYFSPISGSIHPDETSGQNFVNPKMAIAKGAMFARLFGYSGLFAIFAFWLKKFTEIKKGMYTLKYLHYLLIGFFKIITFKK